MLRPLPQYSIQEKRTPIIFYIFSKGIRSFTILAEISLGYPLLQQHSSVWLSKTKWIYNTVKPYNNAKLWQNIADVKLYFSLTVKYSSIVTIVSQLQVF